MSLKHYTKFHQSETMRELERIAVRNGHFDPTPEEHVEAAVAQLKTNFEPSANLFNDIMRFAAALRANGFEAQANEIEKNAFIYKTAERHLYRVFDEDGDDLLDYAHPEGEFDVAPAQEGNGKIETTITQHKRIMDVVNGVATGKLASLANEIVRTAQLTPSEEQRNTNQKRLNDMFSSMKSKLVSIRDWVKRSFPNQASIGNDIGAIGNGFGVTLGLDDSKYTEAIRQMRHSIGQVNGVLSKIKQPIDTSGAIAFAQVPTAANGYEILVNNLAKEVGTMIPGKVGKEIKKQDRPVDKARLNTAITSYNWSLKAWDHALRSYQDADKKDDAAKATKNVETLRKVVTIIGTAVKAGSTMLNLQQALQPYMQIMDEDGILQDAYQTQRDTQSMLTRILETKRNMPISKQAIGLEQPKDALPPAPPIPGEKPRPQPKPGTSAGPGAGMKKGPSTSAMNVSTEERQTVKVMQNLMTALSNSLTQQAKEVSAKLNGQLTPGQVESYAKIIADTGIGVRTAADGVWGPRTKKGLEAINLFTYRAGIGPVDVGEGASPYQTMSDTDTIAKAKSNIGIIAQLIGALELKTKVPGMQINTRLDIIPNSLYASNIMDQTGKIPVYASNVSSLTSFFTYLTGQDISINMPPPRSNASAKQNELKKLAMEVVGQENWWATRPAANPQLRPTSQTGMTAPSVRLPEKDTSIQSPRDLYTMSVAQFDGAFRWFLPRAYQLASMAETPQDGKPVDPNKRQQAVTYLNLLQRLYDEWLSIRSNQKLEPNDPVSHFLLAQWGASGAAGAGAGHGVRSGPGAGLRRRHQGQLGYGPEGRGAGGYDVGGRGVSRVDTAMSEPPFTDANGRPRPYISLAYLEENYSSSVRTAPYLAMSRLAKVNLRSPQEFALEYASDDRRKEWRTKPEALRAWVLRAADLISRELGDIFNSWADELERGTRAASDPRIERLISNNLRELNDWRSWLSYLAKKARSNPSDQEL